MSRRDARHDPYRYIDPNDTSSIVGKPTKKEFDDHLSQSLSELKRKLLALKKAEPSFYRELCAESDEERLRREHSELLERVKMYETGYRGDAEELTVKKSQSKDVLEQAIKTIQGWVSQM